MIQETGNSPVVFGGATELSEEIAAAFQQNDIVAGRGAAPCGATEPQRRAEAIDDADSIIVVFDEQLVESLFGDRHVNTARRRLRACQNEVRELIMNTALNTGARRLFMVCDARRSSFGQRTRAIGWVRTLAHRIGYECSINGLDGLSTSYAVVDADSDVRRTADALVDWHRGGQLVTPR